MRLRWRWRWRQPQWLCRRLWKVSGVFELLAFRGLLGKGKGGCLRCCVFAWGGRIRDVGFKVAADVASQEDCAGVVGLSSVGVW